MTNFTTEELYKLDKYGFITKRNFTWQNHILTIFYLITLSIFSVVIWFFIAILSIPIFLKIFVSESNFSLFTLSICFSCITIAYPLIQYLFFFLKSGVTFFELNKKLEYGDIREISLSRPKIFMEWFLERMLWEKDIFMKLKMYALMVVLPVVGPPFFLWTLYKSEAYDTFTLVSSFFYGYLLIITLLTFLFSVFRSIYQFLHPLYAFWNLWEKIQKFTPEIEAKGNLIQENFQKDMNFRVLSDGFDSLATTFSEIVALVLKLEEVEKKANKGNIFDSEKYINSLRTDIVEPLKSLKSFLEKQKEELVVSQKALTNIGTLDPSLHSGWQPVWVRVGLRWDSGSSLEWQGHTELASKRSESLLLELTENISKLDAMIEKMG